MLNQNWFQDKRFVMFEEYAESQSFFDTVTRNIYVVSEEYGQKGSTIVQEITPESFEYAPNYARYKTMLTMKNDNWIPINSGLYPDDMEDVQVTFIGYNDHEPYCEAFAYRNEGEWFWLMDDGKVRVEITAWKCNCEPYKAN